MRVDDGGGYVVVSDVVFQASTKMLGTKDYVYAISSGAVGDLSISKGMAGDDTIAHSFAQKYEPAARMIIRGISSAGQALGMTASKLLAMAITYLNAEDKAAAEFTKDIDVSSFTKPPPNPSCEPQEVSNELPMVTGSKEVHEIPVIGKFWPQGNPDHLRAAAGVWSKAASLIDDAQRDAGQETSPIPVYCSGRAVTAFTAYVKKIYTDKPFGGKAVSSGQPLMETLSAACRQMAAICDEYATAIDNCRNTLIGLGVGAGIITAAGVILTVFTLGGSDAAAGAGDAALAAEAAAAAETLAAAEQELAAATAVAEAESIIQAELTRLTSLGAITPAALTSTGGSNLAAAPMIQLASATVPPIAPIPSSGAFSPYSPAEQRAAAAWLATLNTRDPSYGTAADRAYQVRVAGQPERYMPTAPGGGVWADGYRVTDGALVDAKNVRDPQTCKRTLDHLNGNDFYVKKFQYPKDDDEVQRYGEAIQNPNNHAKYLEIDTNDPQTVGYWQYIAAAHHVPNDVRYVP